MTNHTLAHTTWYLQFHVVCAIVYVFIKKLLCFLLDSRQTITLFQQRRFLRVKL